MTWLRAAICKQRSGDVMRALAVTMHLALIHTKHRPTLTSLPPHLVPTRDLPLQAQQLVPRLEKVRDSPGLHALTLGPSAVL